MKHSLVVKVLFFLSLFAAPAAHAASCASDSITFTGTTAEEEAAACASLERIGAYFAAMGAPVSGFKIKFVFENQVQIPSGFPGEMIPVHGYFDTDDNSIHMTHFDSASQTARRPWGQPWTTEMASSLLLHEITHLYAITYMGNRFREIPRHWQEFIAYAVELELMPADLRAKVMATDEAKSFDDPTSVNPFFYEADPEKYAIRSYRSLQAWGGQRFLKDLIDFKINATRQ